jgi:DHA1 family multidrug resistance protein-like MFS transporter
MEQESIWSLFRRYPSLAMLCIATAIIMLGQGVTSPVLPLYAKSFGVSAASVGLTIAAFGLARMILNVPVGLASDRFGRRLVLVGGPIVVAVGSILSATAGDLWQLLLWRFVAGAGSAMYMTGAAAFVTDIADPSNRARMLGLNQGSLLAGTSFGPVVGGLVAEFTDYRTPFVVVGMLAAICALWAFRSVPETHTGAGRRQVPPAGAPALGRLRQTFSLAFNGPFFLISMVTLGTFMTRTGGRQTILPLLGADRFDLSPGSLGVLFTLMSLLNLFTVPAAGTLADRWGRKAVIVPASFVTCVSLVMFALAGQVWFLVVASLVQGVGTGFAGPAPAAYVADISPETQRGFAMGLYRTYGDLGFVIGPPIMGWIADTSGYAGALYFNTVLVAVTAVAFWFRAPETVRAGRRIYERVPDTPPAAVSQPQAGG